MAGDGQHFSEYDPVVTQEILGEAAYLLRAIGFASYHAILIGGMVPGLLVLDPPRTAHLETTDLDFCLSIALVEGDTAEYERLETALKNADFEPEGSPYCWRKKTGTRAKVEFFCPADGKRRPGDLFRPKASEEPIAKHNLGPKLSAGAAATVKSSPAYVREDVRGSFDRLALEFSGVDRVGPQSYVRFMSTVGDGPEERARLVLQAQGAVTEFMRNLND